MHLFLSFVFSIWLPIAASFASAPVPAEEHLMLPQVPAGWVKAVSHRNEEDVVEYTPRGQSGENFQDKITIETYQKLNLPLDALQRRAVAQARDACEGIVEGKFQSGLNNGYGSAFWTLGCKRLRRTALGETRYTKAIQSGDTLFVITRLWRTKNYDDRGPDISQRAIQDAMSFLTSAIVCQDGSAEHPCSPARTP